MIHTHTHTHALRGRNIIWYPAVVFIGLNIIGIKVIKTELVSGQICYVKLFPLTFNCVKAVEITT